MKPKTIEDCKILIGTFVINFVLAGASRLSPILFVESITRYDVDRRQASFPYVLSFLLRNISGPLIGYMEQIFGMKLLVVVNCIIATISVAACFFAEDIFTVMILWGIILGLSTGFAVQMLPVLLNEYFPMNKSAANSFFYTGASVGSFVLPIILEVCIFYYGISGSFLILGAILAHSIPAALILRNITEENNLQILGQKSSKTSCSFKNRNQTTNMVLGLNVHKNDNSPVKTNEFININQYCDNVTSIENQIQLNTICSHLDTTNILNAINSEETETNLLGKNVANNPDFRNKSIYEHEIKKSCFDINTSTFSHGIKAREKEEHSLEQNLEKYVDTEISQLEFRRSHSDLNKTDIFNLLKNKKNKENVFLSKEINFDTKFSSAQRKPHLELDVINIPNVVKVRETANKDLNKRDYSFKKLSIFSDFLYLVLLIIHGLHVVTMVTMWTIILDCARDKGVGENIEMYFVVCLPLSDIAGRFFSGFFIDKAFLTNNVMLFISFIFTGVPLFLFIFVSNFMLLLILETIASLFTGTTVILLVAIIHEFITNDKRTMAMSCRYTLFAPMSLAISPMIGYFRGIYGSYDGIFYILFAVNIVSALLVCSLPYLVRRRSTT